MNTDAPLKVALYGLAFIFHDRSNDRPKNIECIRKENETTGIWAFKMTNTFILIVLLMRGAKLYEISNQQCNKFDEHRKKLNECNF